MNVKMKKNVLLIIFVFAVLGGIFFSFGRTSSDDIDSMTDAAVRIQYGWGSMNKLKEMCTDEFKENIEDFYIGRNIYSTENRQVEKISDNETKVTLHVYAPDLTIHEYIFLKTEDGKYLIERIQHDM